MVQEERQVHEQASGAAITPRKFWLEKIRKGKLSEPARQSYAAG